MDEITLTNRQLVAAAAPLGRIMDAPLRPAIAQRVARLALALDRETATLRTVADGLDEPALDELLSAEITLAAPRLTIEDLESVEGLTLTPRELLPLQPLLTTP